VVIAIHYSSQSTMNLACDTMTVEPTGKLP
jgi:hypothetical protein